MKTLRHAVGSLITVGLAATELTPLESAWLTHLRPGGIILFRRNILDPRQTFALLQQATALCAPAPMRAVDIEGGTVDRLRDAVAPLPAPQSVAASANPALFRLHGSLIARESRAFGFNTTLAPVLDLSLPGSRSVLGSRAASAHPQAVADYAQHFLRGLADHHITGCAKHFPGLGGGNLDSHLATPEIDRSWQQLWREDIAPYRALIHLLPMVMINHAAYPLTRSAHRPTTVSPFWVSTVLVKKLGFRGLIFSDDLEMGGILKHLPIEDAAVAAIRAGIHMVEVCHSPELILRCYEGLLREAESSPAFARIVLSRASAALRLRTRLFPPLPPRPATPKTLDSLRKAIHSLHTALEFQTALEPGATA